MNSFVHRIGVHADTRGHRLHALLGTIALWLLLACTAAIAQPAGWSYDYPISVTENSGATLNGYQLRLTLDTASLIAAGYLNADGSDLRFGNDQQGTTLFDYYLESGINTAATVVWVRLPTLPASSSIGIWMYTGNPAAVSASTLNVFDYTDLATNSATNQVFSGGAGGVGNSQRGFRFSPNEDVLVTQFGKAEPTGTTRYVTLFNFSTQVILAQIQVGGPAGAYSYAPLSQPFWLATGTQYVLELYQDVSDGYYFGTSSQINPRLTYFDMRYCNSCTQNTFPTNTLSNYHYGYPDFEFRTRQHATPGPTYAFGPGATTTATISSNASVQYLQPVTFTATVDGLFGPPTGTVSFYDTDGMTLICPAPSNLSATDPPTATCVSSALPAGMHQVTAHYSGDAVNAASISGPYAQEITRADTSSTMSTACSTTFVGGQPFTVSATVAGPNPTGDVSFLVDMNVALCSNVVLVAGSASCTTSALDVIGGDPEDVHSLYASYSGDSNYAPSTVSTMLQVTALNAGDVVFRSGFEDIPAGCPLQ